MPKYTFKCQGCDNVADRSMSVPKFLETKKEKIKCEHCKDGVLFHQIVKISSNVEKSKDQILIEAQEEIRKTVDKVKAGDKNAIKDIYGDRPNLFKNNGVI